MKQKRNKTDIVIDMLSHIQKGQNKQTRLMYKANLTHKQLMEYLGYLETKNLIRVGEEKGSKHIDITDLGCSYLQKLREVQEFEQTFLL